MTTPFIPGYSLIDRYRISAFQLYTQLVSAMRAKDDAEVDESTCQDLVVESIKYAYYFAKYGSLEETYEASLPTNLLTGTSDTTSYSITVVTTTGGSIRLNSGISITNSGDNFAYSVKEGLSPVIHFMAYPGYYLDFTSINASGVVCTNFSTFKIWKNEEKNSIGLSITLDPVTSDGTLSADFLPVPEGTTLDELITNMTG